MRASLGRLLRIRAIEEEQARLELEAGSARLRALDQGIAEAADEALLSRERWVRAAQMEVERAVGGGEGDGTMAAEGPNGGEGEQRQTEQALWETAAWRRGRLEARRPGLADEVEQARARYLDGRRERRTVESVLAAAAEEERLEQERLEQRGLDDWYAARAQRRGDPGREKAG